jgi:plasmid maintenance system killer protein
MLHQTYKVQELAYSMEMNLSWKINHCWASQDIPDILWCSKIHYSVQKAWATGSYSGTDESNWILIYSYDKFENSYQELAW